MQPSPRFTSSSITLEDVSIVCSWDSPSFHRPGLPRVTSARECPDGLKNVYLCGSVEEVWRLRDRFTLLGCFVDSAADSADLPNCQVLPELAEFENALEPLLAAVCSRHVTTIQDMILRNARREPHKLALIYEERQWTYQQLCSAACNLRDQLLEEGLTPSKGPVGVRIDASDYSTICLLALMSGRFTVHTLDRGASSQRYRLKACPSQAIVTMHGQNLDVTEDLHVFHLDEMRLDWSQPLSNLHVDGDLNDVAFIEYTSGSSGTPKAVATVQWRLAHWVPWHLFHFPPGEARDAYNLFWIWYWQLPLTTGSTCVVWPNWQSQDISELMQYFRRHRVTRCNCLTPGQLSALIYVEETLPEDLQEVFVAGEALPLSTCQSWMKKWPHVRLVVNYATTETASDVTFLPITEKIAGMDMPFAPLCDTIVCWNNRVTIVHEELVISGWNVADGYLPPAQSSAFTRNDDGLTNTYRTGDRAQWKDGYIFILGRLDKVVKIRGFRVDTDGLESLLMKHDEVRDVCVKKFDESLYAVVCARDIEKVKTFAKENYEHSKLIVWVAVDSLPINKSGKKDMAAIQQMLSNLQKEEAQVMTYNSDEEHKVAAAYKEVLGRQVARDMPFMEVGGHSLYAMRIAKLLGISPVELFKYPTIADLAKFLQLQSLKDAKQDDTAYPVAPQKPRALDGPLAVVGLACRLPKAISVEHFWDSLKAGHLMTTELPASLGQIPRKGVVDDLGFDCHFWKCSEQQAGMMDTTQRALLEISYESFYSSGFSGRFQADHFRGLELPERNVAVIMCGGSLNHWPLQLGMDLEESRTIRPDEYFNLEVGSDKDYLASSIAYHLDLHGTAEVVQTACSSALVAISRAVQLLKSEHCDSALCGGASFSPNAPIMAVDGLIWAPDGVCRPYAEGANGTTNADGGGVVILSRSMAMHGHGAHASILGSATNNDGARKSTFSAPSYEGQMEVLQRAHADAGILSSEVNYVEGHGTGTRLGDPLEVAALTKVMGQEGHILLGSVKGNVGHLNTAAGVPGFLKTVLVLKHQCMVPSLHSLNPTKEVDWNRTCLSLASLTEDLKKGSLACVSSFGVGGTNAHVVLKASEASQTPWPFEKVTWKRKPLEVLLSSWSRTKQGHRPTTAVPQAPSEQATRTMEDWFYEETREEVRVSELKPKLAAVLLDGDDSMPEGMPKNSVRTNWQRAVPAGKTSGGFLIFLGTNIGEDVDGESQELLLLNCMTLINQLTQSKNRLEVAFILQNTLRYAGLLGFLRSAMKEHPELRLRLMRREDHAKVMFPATPGEFILTTRGLFSPRLRRRDPPPVVQSFTTYERVLVTGGLRGLGLRVGKWLAETGRAKSLVLLGRNQSQGANAEMLETLSRQLPVEVRLGDVSRWEEVEALPNCDLVVHCAGAVKDGVLGKLTKEDLRQVISPKIRGALNIRKKYPTAKKLAFSSSSGLLGVPGQSTYAAGNTFLDAMMPSIQWGGWGETGMAEDLGIQPLPGEHFLPVSAGLECLGRILDAEAPPATRKNSSGSICVSDQLAPSEVGSTTASAPSEKTAPSEGPRLDVQWCSVAQRSREAEEMALPVVILDVYWPVYRQQTTVFAPDDPLLANIEVEIPQSSPDQLKQVWTIGSAGSRYRGNRQSLELCQQHIISGIPVLPGSALVALALEVASKILGSDVVQLQDVKFLMPLELQSVTRQLTLTGSKNSSGGSLRLSSRGDNQSEADSEAVHCTADFGLGELIQRPKTEVEDISSVEDIYEQFAAAGYFYGPDFQGHGFGLKLGMAFCEMPSSRTRDLPLNPAHLDIALQLASLIHPVGMRGAPQSIRRLTAKVGAILMSAEGQLQGDSGEESVDVRIFDKDVKTVCKIEGLVLATMHAGVPLKSSREVWQETTTARRSSWRVVGEEIKKLHLPEVVEKEDEPHQAVAIAVKAKNIEDVMKCQREVQSLAAKSRCWVLCLEGALFAEAAAEAAVEVGAMAILGTAEQFQAISMELGMDVNSSLKIIEENGQLKILLKAFNVVDRPPLPEASRCEPYKVEIDTSKGSKGAQCRRCSRRRPQKGEVEIHSSLWALNFRDVLVAVGAISSNVGGVSLGLGGECYGTVTAIGEGVTDVDVGDAVIATPPDGMGSYLVTDASVVTKAPAEMSPEEAVAGTVAYGTAWLALHWMARIRAGERVLIHSAAGGVGLAALHLCKKAGCEVYATASTEEKRALLRELGAWTFHSRKVSEFEEGILKATNGEGVDVVLNSLSGRAIPASLNLLREFGRFVEIGKRDQYEGTQMELTPFLKGISYHAAHLDILMLKRPNECRKLLEEVWSELPQLPRLPTKTFGMADLKGALEYFGKGIHIGKVLVAVEDGVSVLPRRPQVIGPNDIVTQSLRAAGTEEGGLRVHCVQSLKDMPENLCDADMVITSSKSVAAILKKLNPKARCLILPRWEPLSSLDEWMTLEGHVIAYEDEPEGDLSGWLSSIVEEMAGPIELDTTFEDAGLDSLSLISLARRLSSKVGKVITVADLTDNPTPRRLLQSFAGGPQPQVLRPKAVCLHGFRSNGDALAAQMGPLVSALGSVEWIFLTSPRLGTGPAAPHISDGREWWGNGDFETGWQRNYEAINATLPNVRAINAVGAVGFSQGGAVAALLDCSWRVLFSPVKVPGLRLQVSPCLLTYDCNEEYVEECKEVGEFFKAKQVYIHDKGHDVPRDASFTKIFQEFVSTQL